MPAELLQIGELTVDVVRKPIKHLHLAVYPPDGRVRVSTPQGMPEDAVRAAVTTRLPWIRRQQQTLRRSQRQTPPEMVSGESHYFDGRRHRLRVDQRPGPTRISVANPTTLLLEASPRSTPASRAAALDAFYRRHLQHLIADLLPGWTEAMQVPPVTVQIRSMRTRWGSLSPSSSTITLNLELAKQPRAAVEYVLVHELAHLIDRTHGPKFQQTMDTHMPDWRHRRDQLGRTPALWRGAGGK